MPQAQIKGWLSEDEPIQKALPTKCPKCGKHLLRTDASRLCGLIAVYCKGTPMEPFHWGEIYTA